MMDMKSKIQFDEMPCADGTLGLVTLDNPGALNAITLEMFQALHRKLQLWKDNDDIRLVLIHSESDRAFSSGGDVKTLAQRVMVAPTDDLPQKFFWWEYATDFLVHQFPKPIVCWLDGITMGGGIGISNGASHRIVTDDTVFAMPEVGIGFFPDVGAAYFLNQLPEPVALFLAWTGARLTGADAIHLKLADVCLPAPMKRGIVDVIRNSSWSLDAEENQWQLTDMLGTSELESVESPLAPRLDRIISEFQSTSFEDALIKTLGWNAKDEWIKNCVENFRASSPLSAHVTYHHFKRCRGVDVKEVLAKDWSLAVNLVRAGDFKEGIRAALIDKDRKPEWKHSGFGQVPPQEVQDLLKPADGEDKFRDFLNNLETSS